LLVERAGDVTTFDGAETVADCGGCLRGLLVERAGVVTTFEAAETVVRVARGREASP
jgi:hypothetical protein